MPHLFAFFSLVLRSLYPIDFASVPPRAKEENTMRRIMLAIVVVGI